MTHSDALHTVLKAADISVLSYQEAIELYLALRGMTAQAIEAGTGETRQRLDGASHESAVPNGDAS